MANRQATTIIHPSEAALDFPALAVALPSSERTTALGMFAPLKARVGRLNAACPQLAAKLSAVIAFVGYHFFRSGFRASVFLRYANGLERGFCQRDFMRLSTVFRSSARLRPAPDFCFGMSGSMTAHWSLFKSCLLISPF